jgi:acetolactate synthase-1/2/3 large subunit
MKLSDYVFDFLKAKNIDTVFMVSGGAAAHLIDSLKKSNIRFICNAHEQACAMAAEGYARVHRKPAVVLVTNGPGSTNTLTGVLGAYQDSIPMIVISGQVPTNQSMTNSPVSLRQLGVQECDIISIVRSITKFSVKIENELEIKYTLEKAHHKATTGRMGPVWIDIPINIQSKTVSVDELTGFHSTEHKYDVPDYKNIIQHIKSAKKPLIVTGNGIHLSNTENIFYDILNILKIPVISSWTSKDLFNFYDDLFVGTYGILGERSGNFAVQKADLLLILGSRLSILNVGYQSHLFSPNSKKIMVDIDINEIKKPSLSIDIPIHYPLDIFFSELSIAIKQEKFPDWKPWKEKLSSWKQNHQVFNEPHIKSDTRINSFKFIELLSTHITDEIVVTDMGTSYTCTMQALRTTGKNRLFTSSACCSMGFGLPGAIGASMSNDNVICIAGDGGFQMNIQELQTVIHNKLPIKIFILNNNGYSAISLMQDNLFNSNYVGSTKDSGVSSPDFAAVATAYGIRAYKCNTLDDLHALIPGILKMSGPVLCEVSIIENQLLIPRVQSKKDASGNIRSTSLEHMMPYIDDAELDKILDI